jgi:hypothetical protein
MAVEPAGAKRPDVDLLTTVIGHRGARYRCPDISSVDLHITELHRRIGDTVPRLVEELWSEIDLLLDRRLWLELDPENGAAA